MADYEPSKEQSEAIRAAVRKSIMPLIEQVIVKKLGQATMFLMEEQERTRKPPKPDHTALLRQALDALEWSEYLAKNSELSCQTGTWVIEKAIAKLREALK